jgi:predicted phage terminase large subunit-like protein
VQSVAVTVTGDLVQFTRRALENGRPTWPERPGFDLDGLAKQRISDPELFASNMMNEPSDELTATFKESWLGFYEWAGSDSVVYTETDARPVTIFLADLDIVFLVDPGGFSQRAEDRMRGAIIVTGSTLGSAPKHLILDAYSDKVTYMGLIDQICAFATRYTPRRIGIEESGQQAAFIELVKRELQRRGINTPIEAVKPRSKVKEARILGLEPYFQRGMILVGRGASFHEFRDQYRTFPKSTRVDLLDALAYGPLLWRKGHLGGQSQESRQAVERKQYMERRGMTLGR